MFAVDSRLARTGVRSARRARRSWQHIDRMRATRRIVDLITLAMLPAVRTGVDGGGRDARAALALFSAVEPEALVTRDDHRRIGLTVHRESRHALRHTQRQRPEDAPERLCSWRRTAMSGTRGKEENAEPQQQGDA